MEREVQWVAGHLVHCSVPPRLELGWNRTCRTFLLVVGSLISYRYIACSELDSMDKSAESVC